MTVRGETSSVRQLVQGRKAREEECDSSIRELCTPVTYFSSRAALSLTHPAPGSWYKRRPWVDSGVGRGRVDIAVAGAEETPSGCLSVCSPSPWPGLSLRRVAGPSQTEGDTCERCHQTPIKWERTEPLHNPEKTLVCLFPHDSAVLGFTWTRGESGGILLTGKGRTAGKKDLEAVREEKTGPPVSEEGRAASSTL